MEKFEKANRALDDHERNLNSFFDMAYRWGFGMIKGLMQKAEGKEKLYMMEKYSYFDYTVLKLPKYLKAFQVYLPIYIRELGKEVAFHNLRARFIDPIYQYNIWYQQNLHELNRMEIIKPYEVAKNFCEYTLTEISIYYPEKNIRIQEKSLGNDTFEEQEIILSILLFENGDHKSEKIIDYLKENRKPDKIAKIIHCLWDLSIISKAETRNHTKFYTYLESKIGKVGNAQTLKARIESYRKAIERNSSLSNDQAPEMERIKGDIRKILNT